MTITQDNESLATVSTIETADHTHSFAGINLWFTEAAHARLCSAIGAASQRCANDESDATIKSEARALCDLHNIPESHRNEMLDFLEGMTIYAKQLAEGDEK